LRPLRPVCRVPLRLPAAPSVDPILPVARCPTVCDPKRLPTSLCCRLLLLLLSATLTAGCGFTAQGLNADGTRLHQQGNYQAAAQRFMQAIANNPDDADAHYNLAATFHRMGKLSGNQTDLQQAESYYNQCLDRNDDHTSCYRGLGVLLVESGRPDAAFRLLDGWMARSPSLPDPKIEMARMQQEFGDRHAAREHLLDALTLDASNARALAALGKIREESGEYMQALADYERSLSVNRFQPQVASRVAALGSTVRAPGIVAPGGTTRLVQEPTRWNRY